ncbi:MAG: murein L,D-transpeptidase family protein [Hyphomicrobiaceae bacterium]
MAVALAVTALSAGAVSIELKDVASDRVERQRAAAVGSLPLPGTPDLASFEQRLSSKGLKAGNEVFIRIFKAESELEIWMRSGGRYVLLDTYPVCHWSGTIGPKIHEGDKQTPEGFYEVTRKQLHLIGRHPRSLNLGFPNAFDKINQRTGSYILVHGGCSSVGCFAMTNSVVAEIYDLAERAIKGGQDRVHVHVFPFRMTDANMATYANSDWFAFWQNLKEGYDAFEQTKMPPHIGVCERRYVVQQAGPEEVAAHGPLAVCGASLAAISEWDRLSKAAQLQFSKWSRPQLRPSNRFVSDRRYPQPRRSPQLAASQRPILSSVLPSSDLSAGWQPKYPNDARQSTPASLMRGRASLDAAIPEEVLCDPSLASCRKWLELRKRAAAKALAFRDGQPLPGQRKRTAARTR